MKLLLEALKEFERKTAFCSPWYGIFLNPFYITRRQLCLAIKSFAHQTLATDRILDVGCGAKPYRKLFNSKYYVGIDVKGGGLKDEVKQADMYFDGIHIPYPKETFNVVIATEVLEHAKFPEKLVSEMKRVLKPKGKLFITMPFIWPEHGLPFDFQRFTSIKHHQILKKHGLKAISIKPTTGVFGTCGQLVSDFFYEEINRLIWRSKQRYGIKFILLRLLTLVICFPIQALFLLLDNIFLRRGITLDYIIQAKKK